MTKLSESIVNGVEERLRKIQDNPSYFSEKAALVERELKYEADLHSFWIEHPDLRSKLLYLNGVLTEKEIKHLAIRGVKQIQRAWHYLNSPKFKESKIGILGFLNPKTIEEAGSLVDPYKNHKGFREDYVDSPFPNYTPHSPLLVPSMIERLCQDIKTNDHEHPIELAAEAHLRIAGIQPFKDGNKRTARLIERRILEGYGLPTSFIPFGEREVYNGLIERALDGILKNDIY